MAHSKALNWIVLLLLAFMFLTSGSAFLSSEARFDIQQQEKTTDQKKEKEKEKQAEEKKDDVGDAIGKRMKEGESLFEVLGLPSGDEMLPTTFDLVLLWLIPFSVIVAVVLLIIIVSKRRHQRILAMIEKGILPDASAIKEFRATQFRWDIFLLLTGLILGLGGIGLSVFMMGHKGVDQWYMGIIPFLIGVALLGFYLIFYGKKKE
ncbi:MAG: hypothetical protein OEY18_07575 [Candidatus Aminicenantes bacterium]|nr:hypothetical protein [Candidatus Aminicenantes bacterium]MDH5384550.1 hypothetical protein [Candidatus Aminicenantes bacterium]MDH5743253.1 hypothetical protein [Candidatus Aminicenantes bacterium]